MKQLSCIKQYVLGSRFKTIILKNRIKTFNVQATVRPSILKLVSYGCVRFVHLE